MTTYEEMEKESCSQWCWSDCFPASAAFGRESGGAAGAREGEKMSQGGTDTHQMISWKGTETKRKNGDRITLELQML